MDIKKISSMYSIDVKNRPATENEIEQLQQFSSFELPQDYVGLMRQATELEIKVKNEKYLRIWSPAGCIEMNAAYNVQKYIENSLAIGDDEGGNALIYVFGNNHPELYMVSFGALDFDEAIKLAPSLHELFINNVGLEIL